MRACLDHGGSGLTLHLLHDGSLDADPRLRQVAAMVEGAGGQLVVHGITRAEAEKLPVVELFGAGWTVWLRAFLPEQLPDVDRVLYLDVDTLVTAPLEPLLATDLGGAPIAAVANVYSPDQRGRVHDLGISDHRRYFNSGVLLLDLDRMRAEKATDQLLGAVAERSADDLQMPDQDALNLVFHERWHPLHPRWNAQWKLWEDQASAAEYFGAAAADARRSPAIVHFEGPTLCKPWHALNAHPWRNAWWDALRRTPFASARPQDRGVATTALRLLPEPWRVRVYYQLVQWRQRRSARLTASASRPSL
jgi:lipopolysaccharide biosynthesis glycosyltransferase